MIGAPGPRAVEGSPSWPDSFAPQQTMPPAVSAQVWRSPAASDCAPVTPVTVTGVALCNPVAAGPSWPVSFAPQHLTAVPTMAQTCEAPTTTALAPCVLGTSIGVADCAGASAPSWAASFDPQQRTAPPATAQVVLPPAARPLASQQPSSHAILPGSHCTPHAWFTHTAVPCPGASQTLQMGPQLCALSPSWQPPPPGSWFAVWSRRPAPQPEASSAARRSFLIGTTRTERPAPGSRTAAAPATRSA